MKKVIQSLLVLIIITSFAGCSNEKASVNTSDKKAAVSATETTAKSTKKLSNIENDSYIIYNLSYIEAAAQNGKSSDTIKVEKASGKTTYTYVEHVLSCGTHMNGQIIESTKGDVTTITGSFNVTKNPYAITDLKINITINNKSDTKSGYLIVNGEQLDINSNFTSI